MTVYWAPRSNYAGFLNSLGEGAAGIVTNLIGSQIKGMFDRAARAKEVEALRGIMTDIPNPNGMTELQYRQALMANPNFAKLSRNNQTDLLFNAGLAGKQYNRDRFFDAYSNLYGPDAANVAIGSLEGGWDSDNQQIFNKRAVPELVADQIDLGDRVITRQRDPFVPGIISGTTDVYGKNVSPDEQLRADVEREGYKNAVRVANINRSAALGSRNRNNYQFVNLNGGLGRYNIDTNTAEPVPEGMSLIPSPPKMTADELQIIFDQLDQRGAELDRQAKATKDPARLQSIQGEKQMLAGIKGNLLANISGSGGIVSGAMNGGGSSVWQATYEAAKSKGKSEEEARQMADYMVQYGR